MRSTRGKIVTLLILLVPAADVVFAETQTKFEEATLEFHGRTLRPEHVLAPWHQTVRAGAHLLVLIGEKVVAQNPLTRAVEWQASVSVSEELEFLGSEGDAAYFVSHALADQDAKGLSNPRVLRLDLRKGAWLSALEIPHDRKPERVLSLVARDGMVAIVSASLVKSKEWPFEVKMVGYRVTAFDPAMAKQKWSRTFDAAEEPGGPGALLWAARRPNETVVGIRTISLLGEDLVVCAGSRQDILCLKDDSGETRWSIERLWEFQRGFIGPSVWSHFIGRFGEDAFLRKDKSVDPAQRAAFEERWACTIVGGPIVVRNSQWAAEMGGGQRVFVAVAKAGRGSWSSYLSECLIYELNESGEIWSTAPLPRMVEGSRVSIDDGSLNWIMQNNAQARLQARLEGRGFGPGGSDLVTKVSWFREFDPDESKSWLVVDKPVDPATFSPTHAFRVFSGGFVDRKEDTVFNLPIVSIDCVSGILEPLILHVPLSETVPLPTTNVWSSRDESSHHTWGSYFLGITELRVDGSRLAIVVSSESRSTELTFDLGEAK